MAIKIIFGPYRQGKLIRNPSRRHAICSLKESSANPGLRGLTRAFLAMPTPAAIHPRLSFYDTNVSNWSSR